MADVAMAIGPNCKHKIMGIRPGEKLHEEMVTAADSFNTIELDKHYIICPSNAQFQGLAKKDFLEYYHTIPMPQGFSYNSGENTDWLSIEDIEDLIRKHIACGEGGMITTNNRDLYEKLLTLRTHGITQKPGQMWENHGGWYYEMQELGFNYRLSNISCALGLSQLSRAAEALERRKEIAQKYDEAFAGTSIQPIQPFSDVGHAWHLYVIQTDNRKRLYETLKLKGIHTQVHYIPVHTLLYYRKSGWQKGTLPVAEAYYRRCLSLPMYPSLSDKEQKFVIEQTKTLSYAPFSCNSSKGGKQTHSPQKHSKVYGPPGDCLFYWGGC